RDGVSGVVDDGALLIQVERRVGRGVVEFHFGGGAARVLDLALGLDEGLLEAERNLRREGSLGAARLAFEVGVVGHDVGGIAGRLAGLATEDADVAGASVPVLGYFA